MLGGAIKILEGSFVIPMGMPIIVVIIIPSRMPPLTSLATKTAEIISPIVASKVLGLAKLPKSTM